MILRLVQRFDDELLRASVVAYLDQLVARFGEAVPYRELQAFTFQDQPMSLVQPMRGIRVVSGLPAALSILTTYAADPDARPYDDREGPDGYFRYKWRGTDPTGYDNVALREAMKRGVQLVWFIGVGRGLYKPVYPIWLVGEEPQEHQFVVAFDEVMRDGWSTELFEHPEDAIVRREYALRTVKQRLHQPVFRSRVLVAYRKQCALCRLRHPELLEAAHIKEDAEGGEPVVPNGIAMCTLHHRAFDHHIVGIRPDYRVEIRRDVLDESDGPTLRHAFQGLHDASLVLPRARSAQPNKSLLEARYEVFKATS